MRTKHIAHSLPTFPVYSLAFLSNNRLVLGGGGGTGRSGVKNRIRLYRVGNDGNIDMLDEFELEKDEDAPMSMTVHLERQEIICGINSSSKKLENGENENCRVYTVKTDKIIPYQTCGTFQSSNLEDYQKVTVFSSKCDFLAVGTTNNDVTILSYPTLRPATKLRPERGELYDVTFSLTSLIIAATTHLQVHSLPRPHKNAKRKKKSMDLLDIVKIVDPPSSPVEGMSFRAARFHPTQSNTLYTILNASSPRTRATKRVSRRAYVCRWDTNTWKVVKMRKISDKGVTCFDVSTDGKLIAYGSSDYTIGILDSQTFAPLLTILKAHDFPPTTLRFNPDASLLVSGSADNSVRVVVVPKGFESPWATPLIIILTLVVLLLAVAYRQDVIF